MRQFIFRGILAIAFAVLPARLHTQPAFHQPDEGRGPSLPSILYHEAINLASDTPGLSRLDILYRLDLSFLVAVRSDDRNSPPFKREGEILVELIDAGGHVAARDIEELLEHSEASEAQPGTLWHEGIMTFDVTPARYTVAVTIEDRDSDRQFSEKSISAEAADVQPGKPFISAPFFVVPPPGQGDSLSFLTPVNFGPGLLFGKKAAFALQYANSPAAIPAVTWSCTQEEGGNEPTEPALSGVEENPILLRHSRLVVSHDPSPGYTVGPSDTDQSLLIVAFPAEKLYRKRYRLTVTAGPEASASETSLHFDVVWPEMPRSLRDPDYALRSLRYVTTEEELDSLTSGDEMERRKHLEQFWAKKDRTPETAFNEVMAEYYSRVDHAMTTFGTLRIPDGSLTDRGKVYILYGPPTKTERRLDPSGFMEIWSYKSAGKKFIFLDESKTGTYVLTSTQPL